MARANRDVISRDADLDCAAVERSLAILRTAQSEISGWQAVTHDADARQALDAAVRALVDAESDLHGSTETVRTQDPEAA